MSEKIKLPSMVSRILCMVTLIVFLILKWTSVIDWNWGLVLIPLYVWGLIFILTFVVGIVEVFKKNDNQG